MSALDGRDPYLRQVATEHADFLSKRIAVLLRAELPHLDLPEQVGVAATALATAATILDGTHATAGIVKANGVAMTLGHCCLAFLRK